MSDLVRVQNLAACGRWEEGKTSEIKFTFLCYEIWQMVVYFTKLVSCRQTAVGAVDSGANVPRSVMHGVPSVKPTPVTQPSSIRIIYSNIPGHSGS